MQEVIFTARDGKKIFCSLWNNVTRPVGVVQIIHGMDEHVGRYDRFAKFLNKNGYIVFGDDHRAHGRTVASIDKIGMPDGDPDLFASTADDEIAITRYLRRKYRLPVFLFGHSYGSFRWMRRKVLDAHSRGAALPHLRGDPGGVHQAWCSIGGGHLPQVRPGDRGG